MLEDICRQAEQAAEELIEKAKLKKINVLYIKKGDTLSLGKTKIKCIYPETTTTASDKNDYCTVLSVKNKTSKILLTGDISKEIEEKIKDDIEEKWAVVPDGMAFSKEEIRRQIHFQEQYFDSEIVM